MQKLIWGIVAVSVAVGMGYLTTGKRETCETGCMVSMLTECPKCVAPTTSADDTTPASEVVEVIDLSSVYEAKPTEEEPPLAEFDPRKAGNDVVPGSFPLTGEFAQMELIPLIPYGEEEAEPREQRELLPMPSECDDCCCACCENPLIQAIGKVMSKYVCVKVEMQTAQEACDICPKCVPVEGKTKGSITVGLRFGAGEEEQTERGIEKLPMPRRLADPSQLTPAKRTKIDTMEVRPTDLPPSLATYPFPY